MNDIHKDSLGKARKWLLDEIEFRLPRAWLVIGAVLVAALLIVALD